MLAARQRVLAAKQWVERAVERVVHWAAGQLVHHPLPAWQAQAETRGKAPIWHLLQLQPRQV